MIILDSCHSRWEFDTDQHRFRRVLRGPDLAVRAIATEWRTYHELHVQEDSDSFLVVLNEVRTRMVRSWRHRDDFCQNCSQGTTNAVA